MKLRRVIREIERFREAYTRGPLYVSLQLLEWELEDAAPPEALEEEDGE